MRRGNGSQRISIDVDIDEFDDDDVISRVCEIIENEKGPTKKVEPILRSLNSKKKLLKPGGGLWREDIEEKISQLISCYGELKVLNHLESFHP